MLTLLPRLQGTWENWRRPAVMRVCRCRRSCSLLAGLTRSQGLWTTPLTCCSPVRLVASWPHAPWVVVWDTRISWVLTWVEPPVIAQPFAAVVRRRMGLLRSRIVFLFYRPAQIERLSLIHISEPTRLRRI